MPWAPKSHRPQRNKRHAKTTTERGYGWDWQQLQATHVKGQLCQDCLDQGIVTPATEGHHIQKIKDAPSKRLDGENIRPLCGECHRATTAKGE